MKKKAKKVQLVGSWKKGDLLEIDKYSHGKEEEATAWAGVFPGTEMPKDPPLAYVDEGLIAELQAVDAKLHKEKKP